MKNLDIVLPFYQTTAASYDNLIQQNRCREFVDTDPALICFTDRILPFVIRRVKNSGTTSSLSFYLEWVGQDEPYVLPKTHLTIYPGSSYDDIIYDGSQPLPSDLPLGKCWIRVVDTYPVNHTVYYSETMIVRKEAEKANFTRLDFSNDSELNGVRAGFNQALYIDNLLKTPDFIRTDTGEKIDEIFIPEKRTVQKVCNLSLQRVAEHVIEAVILLPMMDRVKVTEAATGETWYPQETRIKDPSWLADDYGASASMIIQLVRKTIIKKLSYIESQEAPGNMAQNIKSSTIQLVANAPGNVVWDLPFSTDKYDYTVTAYDEAGNPVFPQPIDQTASHLRFMSIIDCTLSVIAVGP